LIEEEFVHELEDMIRLKGREKKSGAEGKLMEIDRFI